MADEWVGIVNSAAPKYTKGAIDLTVRNNLILSMMERRGSIKLNNDGGYEEIITVDWKEPPVEDFGDGGTIMYERRDYLKQATLDVRGYKATDLFTLKEQEMLGGSSTRIVDRYKRAFPKMITAIRNKIGLEFFTDGYTAGNENRFCGIESFCGADTSYDSVGADVADIIAKPSDTYLGLSTAVAQGGTWTSAMSTKPNASIATDWPDGSGDSEYDYFSPKLINTVSTSWTGTNTYASTCKLVHRRVGLWLSLTAGVDRSTIVTVMTGSMMSTLKSQFDGVLNIIVPHREAEDLGFPEVINFEGQAIYASYGVPGNTFYSLNVDQAELRMATSELIKTKGPDYDADSGAWKLLAYAFGNFFFIPKFCAKGYNYASA